VTTVLVLNSHNRKIHSIFLITIAVAARSRYSNFWARRGSVAVGFLFLSRRRGGGALAFFFYRRGAVAVSFLPPWTSLAPTKTWNKYKSNQGILFSFFFISHSFSIYSILRLAVVVLNSSINFALYDRDCYSYFSFYYN
jgi:hypothetical protein